MAADLRRARDMAIAVANAPVTLASVALNAATGAALRLDRHCTVVCEGGWLSERGLSNVYTTGNSINVKAAYAEKIRGNDRVLEHEWRHSVQWAVVGPIRFTVLYALSYFGSQWQAGSQCWNIFEWTAGFADGGYVDCAGLGRKVASVAND